MLDHVAIFTQGGIVLWSYAQVKLKGNPIDQLIRSVLVEQRYGEENFNVDSYSLKWTFSNEFQLIFVVVYQRIIQLLYIEELLQLLKVKFCEQYQQELTMLMKPLRNSQFPSFEFTDVFLKILQALEAQLEKRKHDKIERGPKRFSETSKSKPFKQSQKNRLGDQDLSGELYELSKTPEATKNEEGQTKNEGNIQNCHGEDQVDKEEQQRLIRENIEKFKKKQAKGSKTAKNSNSHTLPLGSSIRSKKETPRKVERVWDDKASKAELAELDFSKRHTKANVTEKQMPSETIPESEISVKTKIDLDNWDELLASAKETEYEDNDNEEEKDLEEEKKDSKTILKPSASSSSSKSLSSSSSNVKKASSGFFSFLKGITGNKELKASDLEPILAQFKEHLISKNVASEIAEKLCESISASLQGKQLGSFQSLKSTVRNALEESLVKILTPKRNIDVLRDVLEAKKQTRPYTIVFVGVNGVGKSTNLAKVCSYLLQNHYTVMFAACDTFRSGAVEQLNVHAKRLQVELFERGYRSDPTVIALDSIRYAKQKGIDVVLIDTAGRMQDNEPLMKALSKLVNTVKPDLVLFVGEALVGNDGIDQLLKFNQALSELSNEKNPRLIDGIILTKFDTIDDKVGASISMVYTTGQPIVFLGTGQHYTDLRRMNVQMVTRVLLKGM